MVWVSVVMDTNIDSTSTASAHLFGGAMKLCTNAMEKVRIGMTAYDETARVWSCTSGKELAMFHDDEVSNDRGKPFVYDVAFSYDAKRLLVGGRDGVGRIWDCNIEDTF